MGASHRGPRARGSLLRAVRSALPRVALRAPRRGRDGAAPASGRPQGPVCRLVADAWLADVCLYQADERRTLDLCRGHCRAC